MDYKRLVLERTSVREFKKASILPSSIHTLLEYSVACKKLIPNIAVEVQVFNHDEVYEKLSSKAGYRGYMIDAPQYMVLLSESHKFDIENAGYIGEDLVLKAVELGIDSCFLSFDDSKEVKDLLDIVEEKNVVALAALGYCKKRRKTAVLNTMLYGRGFENLETKQLLGDHDRKLPLEDFVFWETWGHGVLPEQLRHLGLLDAFTGAKYSPSAHNKQPWRFLLHNGEALLALEKEGIDTQNRRLEAGIIMLNFESIIDQTLFDAHWEMLENRCDPRVPHDFVPIAVCKL